MTVTIESITVHLTREEGQEIQHQILRLIGGSMTLHNTVNRDTALVKLYRLLNGNFATKTEGIHFLRKP
jgi:hypothetical protein